MQKQNSVIKNYILSSEIYVVKSSPAEVKTAQEGLKKKSEGEIKHCKQLFFELVLSNKE